MGEADQEQITRLTQAGAEEALPDALSHAPSSAEMDVALLGQGALLLAVLDRLSGEEGEQDLDEWAAPADQRLAGLGVFCAPDRGSALG